MDDTCPMYWPELLWWLIHHGGPPPPPEAIARLDGYFAAVAVSALSTRLTDKKVALEIEGLAGRLASGPMPAVLGVTQVGR